ncbi:MAG: phage/conjugal plasmid C-4 type zinc finger TraR family protein [Paracoccaceae bacterium]|jgi:phage/conjugal plasmid C-4 type zinc finger TraR family protein
MAGGWAKDGAVQEQIDISVQDAVEHVRSRIPRGDSLLNCEECDAAIPEARREAIGGVRLCINCQSDIESSEKSQSNYNRRGSKDSQLR